MNVVGSIFENNVAGGEGGAIIARKDINIIHSSLFNNKASQGNAIFVNNQNSNLTENWWGENSPNFKSLIEGDISNDFNWIIMDLKTTGKLMQYEAIKVAINFNRLTDSNGTLSQLSSTESLPVFKMTLAGGNDLYVSNGYLSKSIVVSAKNPITFKINNQSFTFNTVKNPSKIINNKNVVKDYNGKITFKVRVIGNDGKVVGKNEVVLMKVAGKTYTVKTDKNGYASKIFSLTPGKYTITATYKGSTVKNTLTVKKVLKAKSTTVKKSKKIKYSASLKSSKGKAISGKKIAFKINGKTYSAMTNKKGLATVTFTNLKVGKYSIIVKYLNSQVKTTLKVKK